MRNHPAVKALCLLLAIPLLFASAAAEPYEIVPMDPEEEEWNYGYRLSGAQKTLMFPLDASVDIIEDTADTCILQIGHDDFEQVVFAFFAFENVNIAFKDLSEFSDEAMPVALAAISSNPEALQFERMGEISPRVSAVWADETAGGAFSKHLVVFYKGWVYNAMAQVTEGTEIPAAALDFQRQLMESMFLMEDASFTSWKISDDVILSVPEPFFLFRFEDSGEDFQYVYLCPDETGSLISLCAVYAVQTAMSKDKGFDDLSALLRKEVIRSAPLSPAEDLILLPVDGYPGIFRYQTSYDEIYAALHRGWLLLALNVERDSSQQWEGDFRPAVLRGMMGLEAEWPVRKVSGWEIQKSGDTLLIPLGERILSLRIPAGYSEDIVADEEEKKFLALVSRDDGPLYLLRAIQVGTPFAPVLAEGAEEREVVFKELSEALIGIAQGDAPDAVLKAEMLSEALLYQPGGSITDDKSQYRMLFCALDDYILLLSVAAQEGILQEDAPDSLEQILSLQ